MVHDEMLIRLVAIFSNDRFYVYDIGKQRVWKNRTAFKHSHGISRELFKDWIRDRYRLTLSTSKPIKADWNGAPYCDIDVVSFFREYGPQFLR